VRFLADENFPLQSILMLSAAGHDVAAIALESPGVPDVTVLERAFREERILLFRFSPSSPEEPAEYLLGLIERFGSSLSGTLTVAERNRLRQRPLPGADRP
jgi:hypothetical protein